MIEKQLESSDATVILISVSAINDGFLPEERIQQHEALVRLQRQERPRKLPSYALSNRSDVRVRSLVPAFVGMLCATFIGFASEIRPLQFKFTLSWLGRSARNSGPFFVQRLLSNA